MTDEIADVLIQRKGPDGERSNLVATGGTIFGNALSMAAARAVMTEILDAGGVRAHAAPGRAAGRRDAGLRRARTASRGTSTTWGRAPATRSSPTPIRDAAEGRAVRGRPAHPPDPDLAGQSGRVGGDRGRRTRLPVPATDEDVDAYLSAWDSLLDALTA